MVIVWSFLAGLFMVYGLPYFFSGVRGKTHLTPFGNSSSQANVVWGWLIIIVGAIFLHLAHNHAHPIRGFIFFAAGALVAGLITSSYWPKHEAKRSRNK